MKNTSRKIISFVIVFLVIAILIVVFYSCRSSGGGPGPSSAYIGPFYTLETGKSWESFKYFGELRKETGAYSYTIFHKAPIKISKWDDEENYEYAFVCASYNDNNVSLGDFRKLMELPVSNNVKLLKKDNIILGNLDARWYEYEITVTSSNSKVFNLIVDLPIDKGYIEIRAWAPMGDEDVKEEFRKIAETLRVTDKDFFAKNKHMEGGK